MTITFKDVPANARASKNFVELAGTKRSLGSLFIPATGGVIGQYDPAKTSVVDYARVKMQNSDDFGSQFGFGSHIHRMSLNLPDAVFLQGGGIYAFPVPEAGGATAADQDITIVGTVTKAGTLFIDIGGELIQVGTSIGDTETEVAAAITTAITAKRDVAVTSTSALGVASTVAKFKGTAGNQILIKINPDGETQESKNPEGITVTLEETDGFLAGGATDPSVEEVFFETNGDDKLGSEWYTMFNVPFTDQTNIDFQVQSAVNRSDAAINRMFANIAGYSKETYAAALALPENTNSEWFIPIWDDRYESPAFEQSAATMGKMLDSQNENPALPFKTLEVSGSYDDTVSDKNYAQISALVEAGMSYMLSGTGKLRLGDIVTSRRTNDSGGDTEEWFFAQQLFNRQAKAYSIEQLFLDEKYQRATVISDADVSFVETAIAPKDVVSDIEFLVTSLWVPFGWTKNQKEVVDSIAAEIDATFNGRIDSVVTDDPAEALRIIATKYEYLY